MRPEFSHKLRNILHSAILVLAMAAIAAACAWTLWGWQGMAWAVIGVALAMLLSPSVPPELVLSIYRARPIAPAAFPEGYAILEELAQRADLPSRPKLYYVSSALLNAFAVGSPRASAVAVTDGMLRGLSLRELAGVLAHEVSHIASNDLWIMTLADIMSRTTTLLSYFGMFLLLLNLPFLLIGAVVVPWLLVLLLLLAPTLTGLLQLALSRAREYDADLEAARLTRDPRGLASALTKLERYQGRLWEGLLLPGNRMPQPSILRSHPPTEERVRRLLELDAASSGGPFRRADRLAVPEGFKLVARPPRWHWPGLWY